MTDIERGQKIRELMKERRMGNKWLAEKTGVHQNTIGRAMKTGGMRIKTLIAIAEGIGVKPATLI